MTFFRDPEIFERIGKNHVHHGRNDQWWLTENKALDASRDELRTELESTGGVVLGPLGFIAFSYTEMGAVSALDLFGLDEMILFSFYWCNRDRYRQVVDMGANIGLHSVLLGRMGFSVTSYEPDPNHVAMLRKHVVANGVQERVSIVQAAVAPENGVIDFVRVLGNTTSSHVAGAKKDPYGELETFEVRATAISDAIAGKDLVKMDVEGLEASLLTSMDASHFDGLDVLCEVGNPENANIIWTHFGNVGVNLYSQKSGWGRVRHPDGMPRGYREGSLFISSADEMTWG